MPIVSSNKLNYVWLIHIKLIDLSKRTYIKFKFEHLLEEYLFYIPDTRWTKALSRLRMSSHMLEIERGGHVKPQKLPLEQHICQRCTSNSVDDEIHFWITCSYSTTQRTSLLAESKLLNSEFRSLSNDDKFIYYILCHLYLYLYMLHSKNPIRVSRCGGEVCRLLATFSRA